MLYWWLFFFFLGKVILVREILKNKKDFLRELLRLLMKRWYEELRRLEGFI